MAMTSKVLAQDIYSHWSRAACFPGKCNCEEFQSGAILQPVCVITSTPYLLLGLWALKRFRPGWLKLMGLLLMLAGVGSMALHASFTWWADYLDFYAILLLLWWFNLAYFPRLRELGFWRLFLAGAFVIAAMLALFMKAKFFLISALGLSLVGALLKGKGPWELKTLLIPAVIMGVGVIFFYADMGRGWCPSNPWLQGHNLWHMAVSLSFSWLIYHVPKQY